MDQKFTARLIRAVKSRPIIYMLNHPEHKNEAKKLEAWREIHRELKEDVPVLKAKWKNLKDSYKKHKLSKKSNCNKAVKKLHSWAWANHMRFIEPTETLESPTEDPNDTVSVTHREERQQESVGREELDITDTQNTLTYKRKRQDRTRLQRKTRLKDEKVDVKCDGVDLLFLGYADTFKKLTRRKQISVKFDMAKIFMEAEMSDLNNLETGTPEENSVTTDEFDNPLHATDDIKVEMPLSAFSMGTI